MGNLQDKVAIVTGAGRGIGRDIALLMAREGAKVVVNDLGGSDNGEGENTMVADQVVNEIKELGGEAVANYDSVAEFENGQKMVEQALNAFGRIDIVVNNAGILRDKMIFKMAEEDFDSVMAVHTKGCYNLTRAAAPYFKEQKGGRFINFTSTSGLIGNYGQANYAAAKLGIWGITKSTALDMARYNVTANAIAPWAWSRMIATLPTETEEQRARVAILKRAKPEHVAPMVAYLATDAASHVTGQIFGVRGKEIMLFSQPRPIRTAVNPEGWTIESIGSTVIEAFKPDFYPLDVSADVFPNNPVE